MANVIKLKNSGTANSAPTSLEVGELAVNYADGKIYYKNISNAVVEFAGSSSLFISNTAPANTNILWADTSVTGVGVVPVGGTTGQVLSKSSSADYDAAWAAIPIINALDNVGDVTITSISTGQFLKWDGSAWVNATIPTINALDDIGDVTITSASSGQVLQWNGSVWINATVSSDVMTDTRNAAIILMDIGS